MVSGCMLRVCCWGERRAGTRTCAPALLPCLACAASAACKSACMPAAIADPPSDMRASRCAPVGNTGRRGEHMHACMHACTCAPRDAHRRRAAWAALRRLRSLRTGAHTSGWRRRCSNEIAARRRDHRRDTRRVPDEGGNQRSSEVIRRHQRSLELRAEQHVALLVSMQSADEEGNQLMRRAISMQSDTYSLIEPRKRSL